MRITTEYRWWAPISIGVLFQGHSFHLYLFNLLIQLINYLSPRSTQGGQRISTIQQNHKAIQYNSKNKQQQQLKYYRNNLNLIFFHHFFFLVNCIFPSSLIKGVGSMVHLVALLSNEPRGNPFGRCLPRCSRAPQLNSSQVYLCVSHSGSLARSAGPEAIYQPLLVEALWTATAEQ